jgi:hypothetical protein
VWAPIRRLRNIAASATQTKGDDMRVLTGVYAVAFLGTLLTVVTTSGFSDFGQSVASAGVIAVGVVAIVYIGEWRRRRRSAARRPSL